MEFCRPDANHYCVECCNRSDRGCSNLGVLPNGTRGCLGHASLDKPLADVFPQLPSCRDLSTCFSKEIATNPEKILLIKNAITTLPPGEFKMGKVLQDVGLRNKV